MFYEMRISFPEPYGEEGDLSRQEARAKCQLCSKAELFISWGRDILHVEAGIVGWGKGGQTSADSKTNTDKWQ